MKTTVVLISLVLLALLASGCGVSLRLGMDPNAAGDILTEDLHIPLPEADEAELHLTFGAGNLKLRGGAQDALVTGVSRYNVPSLKPVVETRRNRVALSSGDLVVSDLTNKNVYNEWDLRLGSLPLDLRIEAGAFDGDMDLGGVALKSLAFRGGASDLRLGFSSPNPVAMSELSFDTGAADVELSGLANANFELMRFRSSLGNFTLDFSGDLQRSAEVSIDSGASSVTLIVPAGVQARVIASGRLVDFDADRDWTKVGSEYLLEGSGPELVIRVNMTAGDLNLHTLP